MFTLVLLLAYLQLHMYRRSDRMRPHLIYPYVTSFCCSTNIRIVSQSVVLLCCCPLADDDDRTAIVNSSTVVYIYPPLTVIAFLGKSTLPPPPPPPSPLPLNRVFDRPVLGRVLMQSNWQSDKITELFYLFCSNLKFKCLIYEIILCIQKCVWQR